MTDILKPGTLAPAFSLPSSSGGSISSDDLKGQPYVLVFYPGDFTPVCTSELGLFETAREQIEGYGARLFGISVDNLHSHIAFARQQGLGFPLLSDFHPKGKMSESFGSYDAETGHSKRSLYLVDADGKIAWSYLSPVNINPGVDGVLAALQKLAHATTPASKPASAQGERDFHFRGDPNSPVTMVEFGDYQCPYCYQAYRELQKVFAYFGDALRFEFRNFPLVNVHPYAMVAALAAEAAGAQGKFWPMHDALYDNQPRLSEDLIVELARELGLDVDRLVNDVNDQKYLPRIRADLNDGLRDGVNGTPSFFINGRRHNGGFDARSLVAAIEAAGLRRAG